MTSSASCPTKASTSLPEQPEIPWGEVRHLPPTTLAWVSKPLHAVVAEVLPFRIVESSAMPPGGVERLVVIGGGTLIDRAKYWRVQASPSTWLLAVPSLWGSGAEASPVVVHTEGGRKRVAIADAFRPDARAVWPELARSVPLQAARAGFGDVWAHALEALFSPLAGAALQEEIATFLRDELLPQPFEPAAAWYRLSATACALQSRASVGLVHGIAHELEMPLAAGGLPIGHAALCATLLWPVMSFNARSPKVQATIARFQLPWEAVCERLRQLHDAGTYLSLLPYLQTHWHAVLRQPLTRTNGALVRPESLAWFTAWDPHATAD